MMAAIGGEASDCFWEKRLFVLISAMPVDA